MMVGINGSVHSPFSEKEEEEMFDTAQRIQQQNQEATPIPTPQEVTTPGTTPMETDEARGEESTALMERKREQERRRRAAVSINLREG